MGKITRVRTKLHTTKDEVPQLELKAPSIDVSLVCAVFKLV
jgi:hypothetical protein